MSDTSLPMIRPSEPPTTDPTKALHALNRLFDRSLRALGDAGKTEAACDLAAQGWKLLRNAWPQEGERLNGTLHYLTRAHKHKPATSNDYELEVRQLAPAQRHALIIERYHALEPGNGYVLVNDRDPKPLYYQFAAEYPGKFTWDPIEEGPEVWRVRIGKTDG